MSAAELIRWFPGGATGLLLVASMVVAWVTGGGHPRIGQRGHLLVAALVAASVIARVTLPITAAAVVYLVTGVVWLGLALTRRGVLRVGVIAFAVGSIANAVVVLANGAMSIAVNPDFLPAGDQYIALYQRDIHTDPDYELLTDETKLPWLADTITLPRLYAVASPGDVLLWISIPLIVVAFAHSSDGKGGPGRWLSRRRYLRRFKRTWATGDVEAARRAVDAGLRAWPRDPTVRFHGLAIPMLVNDFRASADGALAILDEADLSGWSRGLFLWAYADSLLMCEPVDLETAERALVEAEASRPGDITLVTTRALLSLRRGNLHDAAARARRVLSTDAPNEHLKATLILRDALLGQYQVDGRARPELVEVIRSVHAGPGDHEVDYLYWLAAYHSHAGEHARSVAILREAARPTQELHRPSETLDYVLARTGDPAHLPEIDRLLERVPCGYPTPAARSHTLAIRHLVAGDGPAAVEAAAAALDDETLTPAAAAEVQLTLASALDAVGETAEAAENRADARRRAPHHQLFDRAEAATPGSGVRISRMMRGIAHQNRARPSCEN